MVSLVELLSVVPVTARPACACFSAVTRVSLPLGITLCRQVQQHL